MIWRIVFKDHPMAFSNDHLYKACLKSTLDRAPQCLSTSVPQYSSCMELSLWSLELVPLERFLLLSSAESAEDLREAVEPEDMERLTSHGLVEGSAERSSLLELSLSLRVGVRARSPTLPFRQGDFGKNQKMYSWLWVHQCSDQEM